MDVKYEALWKYYELLLPKADLFLLREQDELIVRAFPVVLLVYCYMYKEAYGG